MQEHGTLRRPALMIGAIASIVVIATACSSSGTGATGDTHSSGSGSSTAAKTSSSFSVAWVMSDNLGDHGFNDSAASGFYKAEKGGVGAKLLQASPTDPQVWNQNLQAVSQSGKYNLVYVTGDGLNDDLTTAAKQYPNQKYVDLDNSVSAPNVVSIHYDENEGSYLAGVLAATVSEDPKDFPLSKGDKKVALVAGQDIPVIEDFIVGFKQGVKSVDPQITVSISFIGNFNDAQKAEELTKTQFANGADIAYNVAGPAGLGILKAAAETNHYAIGVDSNQNSLYPKNIVASMLKQIGSSVYDTITAARNGTQKYGITENYGLSNDGVALILNQSLVPQSVQQKLDAAKQQVASGQVKVASAIQK